MTRLLYGYDPLCGWCYGFVPALRHLRHEMPDLPIDPVMGGLVTDDRIVRYAEIADYISGASARMMQISGVALSAAFFDRILGNPDVVASSILPCAAVLKVRETAPRHAADFAAALQVAHFHEGADLNDPATLTRAAAGVGVRLDPAPDDPRRVPPALATEFAATRAMGVTSYPTLILESDGRRIPLATAYEPDAMLRTVALARAEARREPAR